MVAQYSHSGLRRQFSVAAIRQPHSQWIQSNARSSRHRRRTATTICRFGISLAHLTRGLSAWMLDGILSMARDLRTRRVTLNGRHITMKIALLAAASFALISIPAVAAETRSAQRLQAVSDAASDMSDADVLAERHLALYRASRAAVPGLRDSADESPAPISVRTSATAALPLPADRPSSNSGDLSAR
jgi:hypothetical protein